MRLKEYLAILQKLYPADSDDPVVIVQQLACLAGMRLSSKKMLPISCGIGPQLDLDIVQAGVVAGLEKLRKFDGSVGDVRAFLYPSIAGNIRHYAWKRENRVTHGEWRTVNEVYPAEIYEGEPKDDYEGEDMELSAPIEDIMQVPCIEDTIIFEETEAEELVSKAIRLKALPYSERKLLEKDSALGANNGEGRRELAEDLGVSVSALYMRVRRIREKIVRI